MRAKDFVAMADVIREQRGRISEAERRQAARLMATAARKVSPYFDIKRFYTACEFSEGEL